jgi:hypothetical protein
MATILWAVFLIRRMADRHLRFLVGLVGFISIYQAGNMLKDAGFIAAAVDRSWSGFAGFIVSILLLLPLLVITIASREHLCVRKRLRLREADARAVLPGWIAALLTRGQKFTADDPALQTNATVRF